MVRRCCKCGNTLVTIKYNPHFDRLEVGCGCGYIWHEDPLDKREAKIAERARGAVIPFSGGSVRDA